MKIIDVNENFKIDKNTILALGNFDGIHKGHRFLIDNVRELAKKNNFYSGILLFNSHTLDSLHPELRLPKLTDIQDKIDIISDMNIDYVFLLDFKKISNFTPEEFIFLLKNEFNCKGVVVGSDYKFGKGAKGNILTLKDIAEKEDIFVKVIDDVTDNSVYVKSTVIREEIRNGNIKEANKLLSRNYFIKGIVVHGEKRGRELGYPTANIYNDFNYILPKEGVYYTKTTIISKDNNKQYDSLSFIGQNITFNEFEQKIETYLFDFAGYLYGDTIKIEFIDFIRNNEKFDSKESLILQMNKDVEFVKDYNNNLHF
ncbi:bifunctional riboflavin kinase/FAD synthetase [Miniphocaeibacter massiliensis]|uniref:bifunctional riboflavin kinase/FAD synthetase n=1 Tax=Miniphocaeibacter massiliensis TaxID=2041841 RepID=UPI000C070BDA|nr:bifunctional riboflavin kinase/FAD synthetase [Miniphocaeibacter massiliensis]